MFSIFNSVFQHDEELDPREFNSLARYFNLDVGGGVRPYIRGFLKQMLNVSEEKRNEWWSMVNTAVRNTERFNDVPEKIESSFPKTFEEAVKFYK